MGKISAGDLPAFSSRRLDIVAAYDAFGFDTTDAATERVHWVARRPAARQAVGS